MYRRAPSERTMPTQTIQPRQRELSKSYEPATIEPQVLRVWQDENLGHAEPGADWLEGVERWMRDVRAHLVAHPWAATMLGTSTTMTAAWTSTVAVLKEHLDRSPLSTRARASTGWPAGCRLARWRRRAWPRHGSTPATSPTAWVSRSRRATASSSWPGSPGARSRTPSLALDAS